MKAWLEDFMQVAMRMFARLRRTGWVILSPVMTEILVLSDERMTPRRVAPSGRNDCSHDENQPPWIADKSLPASPMWRLQLAILCRSVSFVQRPGKSGQGRSPCSLQKEGFRGGIRCSRGNRSRIGILVHESYSL